VELDTVLDGVNIRVDIGVGLDVVDVSISEHSLLGKHPFGKLNGEVLVSRLNSGLLSVNRVLVLIVSASGE
jgi:hypothetical protein